MVTPVPLHFGALHAYEQVLVLLLAFGPFVVLGVVVAVQRRRAISEEDRADRD
jgi:Na+-translocating ferredoxin:NAD+ oxidoreductase RnfE subunit